MPPIPLHDHFYGPGLHAELGEAGERIWLQVELLPGEHAGAGAVRVEVLHQPLTKGGFPFGNSARIFDETWNLNQAAPALARTIFGWLPPGINPTNARQCHYRVTPVKMDSKMLKEPVNTP